MPQAFVYTEYGGPETQKFAEVDIPKPGAREVLVKVVAAGVNPADWKRRSGMRRTGGDLEAPVAHGLEVAGVVEALGPDVDGFAVGDEVFGSVVGGGGYAQYSLLSLDAMAKKPASVSFNDAATLPVAAATAYDGVEQLALRAGATLVVTGAGGGVGIATVQIAVARGIRVIGTASESKRALVEGAGGVHVAYGPGVADRVRALAPNGVDALYDLVGGDAIRELADLVADRSKLITAADPATATELGGGPVQRKRTSDVLEIVAGLVADGTLEPHVTEVFPLERADEALALVEAGHATGKVVIEID